MTDLEHVSPPAALVPVNVDEQTLVYLGYDPANIATRALVLLARRYELDPLLGEIRLIDSRDGSQLYVTRNGMLAIAHRSGMLDGIVVDQQRRNSTDDGWTAYVSVWRKDMSHPFTYGAQCKDTESQAKRGNGPEMALARAERRALLRAFQIRTDFYPEHPQDELDATDIAELDEATAGPGLSPGGETVEDPPAPPAVGADWEPSLDDQSNAHRAIGSMRPTERSMFLANWDIEAFEIAWPPAAVADALGIELADG